MQELYILKLGGSVITNKENTDYTVRTELLHDIFTELALFQNANPQLQLIIVHGAGGHIHHLAHTYELTTGTDGDTQKTEYALEVQKTVEQLGTDIHTIALECGLDVHFEPTPEAITQTNKKIDTFDVSSITDALVKNHIPLLRGDMVTDMKLGMSICSGDAIVAHLARHLPVTKLFFATDVDGIYTKDPHIHIHSDAQLVEHLTFSDIKNTIHLEGSHNTDTTGGLHGKIQECADLFEYSQTLSEIHIFNGLHKENYIHVLDDKSFAHSVIKKE